MPLASSPQWMFFSSRNDWSMSAKVRRGENAAGARGVSRQKSGTAGAAAPEAATAGTPSTAGSQAGRGCCARTTSCGGALPAGVDAA